MNQRTHLVADTLDAMLAAASIGERGTFVRLKRGDLGFGKCRLDLITRRERAGRTWCGGEACDASVSYSLHGLDRTVSGHVAKEAVVRKEFELGQCLVLRVLHQLTRSLQRENDVGLGAARQVQLAAILSDSRVALLAHGVRHDDDCPEAEKLRDIGRTNTEVARGRAENGVFAGNDVAVNQTMGG